MEHRWNERKHVHMNVVVYEHGIPMAICKTQDISIHGMYIITRLKFTRHTTLQIEFTYPGTKNKNIFIPASVARSDKNGLGLMLYSLEPKQKAAINQACQTEEKLALASSM